MAWDRAKGNSVISAYEVTYEQIAGGHSNSILTSDKFLFLTRLLPRTSYAITVRAHTQRGIGPKSDLLIVTTPEALDIGPPLNLRVIGTTPTSVSLEWDEVISEEVTNYEVQYTSLLVQGFTESTNFSVTVTGLQESTSYEFSVRVYTENGTGPFSKTVTALTKEDSKPSTR